jgi:lipopolysaccharide export system permease protein
MRLLDRYLFRELLTPLAYCLGGFLIFWVSYELFNELDNLQGAKLHLFDVIELCVAWTPDCLVTVLPIALLLASLYTLTHHARHNEITAMRAAGVSLWRLCVPYFIIGFIASLVLFALNEFCVPYSTGWAERIKNRYVQKSNDPDAQNQFRNFGFTNARGHRTWFVGEYRPRTVEMFRPKVNWSMPDGARWELHAARAVRTNGIWTFFDVKEYTQSNATAPLLPFLQTNMLAMPEFDETPKEIRSEIKISAYGSLRNSRKTNIPLTDIWDYLRLHPTLPDADSNWLLTKLYGRLAMPWTCFVVMLIAIPFGVAAGQRSLFVGVAGSIFICFTFFVLQQVGLVLGMGGWLPAWLAAWLPNLAFGATGLLLIARIR